MYKKEFKAKDGTKIIFREPKKNDAKELLKFINSFSSEAKSGILMNERMTLKKEEKWLNESLSKIKENLKIQIFAEHNGKIVGECSLNRKTLKESHRSILGIAIIKDYRHKGIGTRMIKEIIKLARKRMKGLKIVELGVIEYNKAAKGLYKKIGFKKVSIIPKAIKEGNRYFAEEIMQLYLK